VVGQANKSMRRMSRC